MKHLCTLLYQDIITIIQSSHCAVIYQCAYEHTTSAIQRQWTLPKMLHDHQSRIFRVQGLFPYWMSASSCVKNDLDLRDIVFLTAPNMAGFFFFFAPPFLKFVGKSTLMRSVLVAALLGNCGLFVPCSIEATMPEYDAYFLRTSSFDAPIERKSSFAVEMSDLRVIMRDATQYSFVMLDEIGLFSTK